MLGPDPYSNNLLGEKLVLMRKQLRSVVRSSCQNVDEEKQGEGCQQRMFSACLVALNAKVGFVYMTKIGRKSGMPLLSWRSEEATAETFLFWRLKSQGVGVRKTPAQVAILRSFSLCSENGLVGPEGRPRNRSQDDFENQTRLVNIFKVVAIYQMSCVTMRCCQALFVGGRVTL